MVAVLAASVALAMGQGAAPTVTIRASVYDVTGSQLKISAERVSQRDGRVVFEGVESAKLDAFLAEETKAARAKLIIAPVVRALDKQAATVSIESGSLKTSINLLPTVLPKDQVSVSVEAIVVRLSDGPKAKKMSWSAKAKAVLAKGNSLVIVGEDYPFETGRGKVMIVVRAEAYNPGQR